MLRFVNICLVLALVALAYVIYEGKYKAGALDEDISGLRKDIDRAGCRRGSSRRMEPAQSA